MALTFDPDTIALPQGHFIGGRGSQRAVHVRTGPRLGAQDAAVRVMAAIAESTKAWHGTMPQKGKTEAITRAVLSFTAKRKAEACRT